MKQYNVIYTDDTTEVIEAYAFRWAGTSAAFDLGRGRTRRIENVKFVECLG